MDIIAKVGYYQNSEDVMRMFIDYKRKIQY